MSRSPATSAHRLRSRSRSVSRRPRSPSPSISRNNNFSGRGDDYARRSERRRSDSWSGDEERRRNSNFPRSRNEDDYRRSRRSPSPRHSPPRRATADNNYGKLRSPHRSPRRRSRSRSYESRNNNRRNDRFEDDRRRRESRPRRRDSPPPWRDDDRRRDDPRRSPRSEHSRNNRRRTPSPPQRNIRPPREPTPPRPQRAAPVNTIGRVVTYKKPTTVPEPAASPQEKLIDDPRALLDISFPPSGADPIRLVKGGGDNNNIHANDDDDVSSKRGKKRAREESSGSASDDRAKYAEWEAASTATSGGQYTLEEQHQLEWAQSKKLTKKQKKKMRYEQQKEATAEAARQFQAAGERLGRAWVALHVASTPILGVPPAESPPSEQPLPPQPVRTSNFDKSRLGARTPREPEVILREPSPPPEPVSVPLPPSNRTVKPPLSPRSQALMAERLARFGPANAPPAVAPVDTGVGTDGLVSVKVRVSADESFVRLRVHPKTSVEKLRLLLPRHMATDLPADYVFFDRRRDKLIPREQERQYACGTVGGELHVREIVSLE